jgi:hypothetical protein
VSRDSRDWLEDEGLQIEAVHSEIIQGKVFSIY